MENNKNTETIKINLSADSFLALKRFINNVSKDMEDKFSDNDFYKPDLDKTSKNHDISIRMSKNESGDVTLFYIHDFLDEESQAIITHLMSKENSNLIDRSEEDYKGNNIPLGTRLNFNPSPEEFEDLKALSDEDGYIKFGG